MYIIADSSSTRTEWALVDNDSIIVQAQTQGLNPYFLSRREISHCIRLELPDDFFKKRWSKIFFYGAGCANLDKNKILEQSLVAQFRTPVEIHSDLLGAARGLFNKEKGLPCILGTGSNSCIYDGTKIKHNIRPAGYIMGDEGSGAYIGKSFISDCLKGLAPKEIIKEFYEETGFTPDEIMDEVYTASSPSRILSRYSQFLIKRQTIPYVHDLIKNGFRNFFERNILQYEGYRDYPLAFVGSIAVSYENILREVTKEYEMSITKICTSSLLGLIKFHSSES